MASLDVIVRCDSCHDILDADFDRHGDLMVTPCERCVDEARKEGYNDRKSEE